jgi:hypothetical protein
MEPAIEQELYDAIALPSRGIDHVLIPCPCCGTYFKYWSGFTEHMTVDHWWDWHMREAKRENRGPGIEKPSGDTA